jgi:hypothetical protein
MLRPLAHSVGASAAGCLLMHQPGAKNGFSLFWGFKWGAFGVHSGCIRPLNGSSSARRQTFLHPSSPPMHHFCTPHAPHLNLRIGEVTQSQRAERPDGFDVARYWLDRSGFVLRRVGEFDGLRARAGST